MTPKARNGELASIALLAVLVAAPAALAQQWRQESLYPARVRAMSFQGGYALNANQCVSWGAWSVCFGPAAPVAELSGSGFDRRVTIKGLRCRNQVRGESECEMGLVWRTDMRQNFCVVFANPSKGEGFDIGCPTSLQLE